MGRKRKRSLRKRQYSTSPVKPKKASKRKDAFEANGLVRPDAFAKLDTESEAFVELRKQWYAKVAKAESLKEPEEQWKDIEWAENPESPHIKKPASRGRNLVAGKELYYRLARNYLEHNTEWEKWELPAWRRHADGMPYRDILRYLRGYAKCKKSIYWLFYFIADIRAKCFKWNKEHPEGLYYQQPELNIEELTGESMLDKGFWEYKR